MPNKDKSTGKKAIAEGLEEGLDEFYPWLLKSKSKAKPKSKPKSKPNPLRPIKRLIDAVTNRNNLRKDVAEEYARQRRSKLDDQKIPARPTKLKPSELSKIFERLRRATLDNQKIPERPEIVIEKEKERQKARRARKAMGPVDPPTSEVESWEFD